MMNAVDWIFSDDLRGFLRSLLAFAPHPTVRMSATPVKARAIQNLKLVVRRMIRWKGIRGAAQNEE